MASRGLWHFMSARTRRSLALSWSALFVLSLLLQYFSFAVASPALAAVGTNIFELDGNAVDSTGAGLPDDWDRIKNGGDSADSKLFITDGFNLNDDIFTGGGSKDISPVSSWAWKTGSVQDKDDIENAFAAAYTSGGSTYVYFGLDRYQTSGDATAGFWFLKSGVGKGAGGSFTGAHVEGDVLVVLDFSNGGAVASAQIYTWHNGALTAGASGTKCDASAQDVCAISNTATATAPWPYDDKGAAGANNDFPANALFEGGINLTALKLDTGCFSTFIAETRSSNSETATLSDLAIGSFSLCATPVIATQVKKDGQSTGSNGHITIGDSVTDTVTITGSKGTPTGTVEFFSCFNAGSTPDCSTGGTSRGTKTLAGGIATSDAFTPTAAGNYCFRVDYTPAAGSHYLPGSHTNSTTECFVVDKQPTSITTSADQTVDIGASISDAAVLHDATADATGTITFKAFGPGTGCSGTAAFTTTEAVVGGKTNYGPVSFTPLTAGVYHWIASYGGDAKNAASSGACLATGENDTVNKVTPAISTEASAAVTVGGQISDTATVTGGHNPTGDVTFRLYGPADQTCASAPIFTSANRPLSGGSATSAPFTTALVGTYHWIATYNGDANNTSIAGKCGDAGETVVVNPTHPTITTSLVGGGKSGANITVPLGTQVHDTSTLSGATADAGGTVHYQVFDNPNCSGSPTEAGTANVVNGVPGNSINITFNHAGTFYWQADYSGDTNNSNATSACNLETVTTDKAIPTVTTNASASVQVGGDIHDTATLSGGFNPTGSITFTLFGPDNANCAGLPIFTSVVTVDQGNHDYTSASFTTTTAGTYRWIANYSGDGDNAATVNSCNGASESVIVSKKSPTVTTNASASVPVGGDIHDTATLAGGFSPTGSITFTLFGPDNATCTGTPIFTDVVTVSGNKNYDSLPFTTTAAGTYRWIANYGGDANNNATSNSCNGASESVIVSKKSPTVSTQATPGAKVGDKIHDVATVSGGFNPTGDVTFKLYAPSDPNCDGQAIFTDVVALGLDGTATSGDYMVTEKGNFHWVASYGGDANNESATGACGDEGETTVVNQFSPAITTTLHSGNASGATITVLFGSSVTDQAVLTGASATAGGTVTYSVYDNPNCSGEPIAESSKTVTNGVVPASDPVVFPSAGTYYWQASYGGDAANAPARSICTDEVLTVTTPNLDVVKLVAVNGGAFAHTGTAQPGDTLNYKITITNSGDAAATNVPVSDDISALLAHGTYNADCSNGCAFASNTLTWTIPTIAADGSVTLTFSVTLDDTFPAGQTDLPNVVLVTGPGSNCAAESQDPLCDTDTTVEAQPNLNVEKLVKVNDGVFAHTGTANPGDTLNYQITINNSGNADAKNVPVSDDISALLAHGTYNADCSNGCSFASNTLTWTIPVIAAGDSVTLTFSVDLDNTFPEGQTDLPNVVVVTGPGSNCEPQAEVQDANCDTDTTVAAGPNLSAEKLVAINDGDFVHSGAAKPGDTLNYKITVSNSGDAAATNVPVSDDISGLLAHGTYDADCSNGCTFTSGTLHWTIPTIAAGGSVTLTFSVTLGATFPTGTTDLPNVVVVTGPGSNCIDNSDDAACGTEVSVSTSALVIDKSVAGNTGGTDPLLGFPIAKVGDTLHYSLKYTGAGTLTNAVITDTLPAGLDYVAGSATGNADFNAGTYDSATRRITWHAKGVLPDPASGSVGYDVKVAVGANDLAQPLVNLATIKSDETPLSHDSVSVLIAGVVEALTPPPTSTLTPETGTSNPGFALMLVLLGIAGLALAIGFVTPVPARVRRRDRLG